MIKVEVGTTIIYSVSIYYHLQLPRFIQEAAKLTDAWSGDSCHIVDCREFMHRDTDRIHILVLQVLDNAFALTSVWMDGDGGGVTRCGHAYMLSVHRSSGLPVRSRPRRERAQPQHPVGGVRAGHSHKLSYNHTLAHHACSQPFNNRTSCVDNHTSYIDIYACIVHLQSYIVNRTACPRRRGLVRSSPMP
jgi:hypothetical protein